MVQFNYPFRSGRGGLALGFSNFRGSGEKTRQYADKQLAELDFPLVLEPTIYLRAGRRNRLLFLLGSNINVAPEKSQEMTTTFVRLGMGYDIVWQ